MTRFKRIAVLPLFGCIFLCVGAALHFLAGCHTGTVHSHARPSLTRAKSAKVSQQTVPFVPFSQKGYASWYGGKFHGRRTASGAVFNMHALTAAHRTLPLNSYARVTNLENNRQVIVKITDRGPFGIFHRRRIIDLSDAAARTLDMHQKGEARVLVQTIPAKEAVRQY